MSKSLILATVAVSALAFAVSANAETAKPAASSASSYVEVGASTTGLQGQNFGTVNFTIGKSLTKSFALEAEGNIGVTHNDTTVSNVTVHTKVDYAVAGYAVGIVSFTDNSDLIGRVGYMHAQVKAYAGGYSATQAESGLAVGVGIRYFPNAGNAGVRADFTHYSLSHDTKGDILQVSYIRRF